MYQSEAKKLEYRPSQESISLAMRSASFAYSSEAKILCPLEHRKAQRHFAMLNHAPQRSAVQSEAKINLFIAKPTEERHRIVESSGQQQSEAKIVSSFSFLLSGVAPRKLSYETHRCANQSQDFLVHCRASPSISAPTFALRAKP